MKRRIKQCLSLMLCLLFCFSITAYALQDDTKEATPENTRYTNIINKSCGITISGINSTSIAYMQANGSMSLKIKMELQKLKSGTYSTIETWTSSKTGTIITMEEERLINILATYRLKVTFTAGSETLVSYAYP